MFSGSVRWKVIITENVSFIDHASGIRLPDGCKLVVNWKNNDVTIFWNDVIVKLFWRLCVLRVSFSNCSKFHVNIMTVSRVMRIFIYKGLTRNLGTIKYPCLSFAQYLETGESYWKLQSHGILLPFLNGKTKRDGE